MFGGAILLLLSDLFARLVLAPAELPIGIVTGTARRAFLPLSAGAESPLMLRAENLTVQRGGAPVLHDLSLTLEAGEVLGVLGPNGAGKSTLLGALSGELAPSRGQSTWTIVSCGPGRGCPVRVAGGATAVRPASTSPSTWRPWSALAVSRTPAVASSIRRIVAETLRVADAGHLAGRSYLALSGGERQRVHLARVLTQLWPGSAEQVLLLDEPTSALDPLHQHSLLQAVRDFAERGVAVLVVLHDLESGGALLRPIAAAARRPGACAWHAGRSAACGVPA